MLKFVTKNLLILLINLQSLLNLNYRQKKIFMKFFSDKIVYSLKSYSIYWLILVFDDDNSLSPNTYLLATYIILLQNIDYLTMNKLS